MKKSEKNLIIKFLLFLFGLTNVVPSKINIYERIVDLVSMDLQPTNKFYMAILLGIWFFRILIIVATVYELYGMYKYDQRYKVTGLL